MLRMILSFPNLLLVDKDAYQRETIAYRAQWSSLFAAREYLPLCGYFFLPLLGEKVSGTFCKKVTLLVVIMILMLNHSQVSTSSTTVMLNRLFQFFSSYSELLTYSQLYASYLCPLQSVVPINSAAISVCGSSGFYWCYLTSPGLELVSSLYFFVQIFKQYF